MTKDVFFNELSIPRDGTLSYMEVVALKGLYMDLSKISSIEFVCRIDHVNLRKIVEGVSGLSNGREAVSWLYAFLRPPFEGDSSEDDWDLYAQSQWTFGGKDCFGLAMAYVLDTLTLSINRKPWNTPVLQVDKDNAPVDVRNCSSDEHVDVHASWIAGLTKPELVLCDTPPEDKPIKLRDDHGVDVLREFSRRLIRSPYVTAIINSLEFHPKSRRFIHGITDDGKVSIILNWTDAGLGLVMQTTGRNRRETEEIARRIEDEYGHIS